MYVKTLFFNLIWRFVLLIATSLGIVFIAFRMLDRESVFTLVVGGLIFVIQIYFLSRYVLRINKILITFIDSVGLGNATELQFRESYPVLPSLESRLNQLKAEVSNSRFEERKQRSLLDIVVDSMDTGLICINQDREVVFSNKSAHAIMMNKPISHIGELESHLPSLAIALESSKTGTPKIISLPQFKASVRCKHFVLDKGDYSLFSIQNIQREVDAQETESWQKLIRVLTHEIMNSMGPILSLSKSLKNSVSQSDKLVSGLSAIENTGEGLINFIKEYRKLSTLPSPEKKTFPIAHLFNQLESLFSEEFSNSQIQLEVHVENPELELFADQHQVEQILINLIKNASDSLKTSLRGRIRLKAVKISGMILIQVEDNGPGIPDNIRDQIFVPFYSTKTNGTGIGLSLSRQIMNNHDGTIQFSSIPNEKTIFTLSF